MVIKSRYLLLTLALGLVLLYGFFDPAEFQGFPACPFRTLSGFMCPGCGSQRAMHDVLSLQFAAAWNHNPLLVLSLPYLLIGVYTEYLAREPVATNLRRKYFGAVAAWLILGIVLSFSVLRNL